jgi:hypothetical protein
VLENAVYYCAMFHRLAGWNHDGRGEADERVITRNYVLQVQVERDRTFVQ